jgi:hypothetical protein
VTTVQPKMIASSPVAPGNFLRPLAVCCMLVIGRGYIRVRGGGGGLRRVICATLVACVALGASGSRPSPAFATASCVTSSVKEQTIFWADKPSGSWRRNVHGETGNIELTERDLNPNCAGYISVAWSTSHIVLGNVWGDWLEVGFYEGLSSSGGRELRWFTEGGTSGTTNFNTHSTSWPCSELPYGSSDQFRVHNYTSGTTNWRFLVNCNDGTGWQILGTRDDRIYDYGVPAVETGRRGFDDTGMSDDQVSLQWKNSSFNWNDWANPACIYDDPDYLTTANNWEGVQASSTEYSTQKGSGQCDHRSDL